MKLVYEAGLLRNAHEDCPGILGVGTVHDHTAFVITPSWQPPADPASTPGRAFVYGGEDARAHLDGVTQVPPADAVGACADGRALLALVHTADMAMRTGAEAGVRSHDADVIAACVDWYRDVTAAVFDRVDREGWA